EVQVNDIIGADIYSEGRKIIAKNTPLTERLIALLKNRGVKNVHVVGDEKLGVKAVQNVPQNDDFNELFFDSLKLVGSESRYGNLVTKTEDMDFVIYSFRNILNNRSVVEELYKLRNWDLDTYI